MHLPDGFIIDLGEKFQAMRDIRKDAGLSQQAVAKLLGVDQSRISRWEKGQEAPHFQELVNLCRLLDNLQLQQLRHAAEEDDH